LQYFYIEESKAQSIEYEEDCCCCPADTLDPFLWWFWLFRAMCTIDLFVCLMFNLSFLFIKTTSEVKRDEQSTNSTDINLRDYILHIYAAFFCIAGILTELELSCMKHYVRVLQLWIFRGLFYIFTGVLTSCFTNVRSISGMTIWANTVSILLCALGLIYTIMGLFCVKSRLTQKQNPYTEIRDTSEV